MQTNDLHWLAGLLEGEGCFRKTQKKYNGTVYNYPVVKLNMTDQDIITRVSKLFGVKFCRVKNPPNKDSFQLSISGSSAMRLMTDLKPLMGQRRRRAIADILQSIPAYTLKLHRLGRL